MRLDFMLYFSPLSLQSLLIAIVRFRAWQGTNVAQENDAANVRLSLGRKCGGGGGEINR